MHAISFCISFPQILFVTLRCLFDSKNRNSSHDFETKWMNIIILQIVKWQGSHLTKCHDQFLKILHYQNTWSWVKTSSQVSKRSLYYLSMYLPIFDQLQLWYKITTTWIQISRKNWNGFFSNARLRLSDHDLTNSDSF